MANQIKLFINSSGAPEPVQFYVYRDTVLNFYPSETNLIAIIDEATIPLINVNTTGEILTQDLNTPTLFRANHRFKITDNLKVYLKETADSAAIELQARDINYDPANNEIWIDNHNIPLQYSGIITMDYSYDNIEMIDTDTGSPRSGINYLGPIPDTLIPPAKPNLKYDSILKKVELSYETSSESIKYFYIIIMVDSKKNTSPVSLVHSINFNPEYTDVKYEIQTSADNITWGDLPPTEELSVQDDIISDLPVIITEFELTAISTTEVKLKFTNPWYNGFVKPTRSSKYYRIRTTAAGQQASNWVITYPVNVPISVLEVKVRRNQANKASTLDGPDALTLFTLRVNDVSLNQKYITLTDASLTNPEGGYYAYTVFITEQSNIVQSKEACWGSLVTTGKYIPVMSVTLNYSEYYLESQKTVQLEATIVPPNATNKSLQWTSNYDSIATVNNSGLVTPVSGGLCTVTATTVNNIAATCEITTRTEIEAIELLPSTTILNRGDSYALTVVLTPNDATPVGIMFYSNNPSVVAVDPLGRITRLTNGAAVITAITENGLHKSTCTLAAPWVNPQNNPSGSFPSSINGGKAFFGCVMAKNITEEVEKVYCLGGVNSSNNYRLNEFYDTTTSQWETGALIPITNEYASCVVVNNIIYYIGGRNGRVTSGDNNAYNPITNTWSTLAPMPTPRVAFGCVVLYNKIYCVGGGTTSGRDVTGINEAYDIATDTWSTLAPMPTPRELFGCAVMEDGFFCIGGLNTEQSLSVNESYDLIADVWYTMTSMITSRSQFTATTIPNGNIYCLGGYGGNSSYVSYLDTNEVYNAYTNSWMTSTSLPVFRCGHSAIYKDNKIYILGGFTGPAQTSTALIEIFDPSLSF